jgi:hypothetical protein
MSGRLDVCEDDRYGRMNHGVNVLPTIANRAATGQSTESTHYAQVFVLCNSSTGFRLMFTMALGRWFGNRKHVAYVWHARNQPLHVFSS